MTTIDIIDHVPLLLPPQSEQIDKIAPAYFAAQGDLESAVKRKVNSHFGGKYADIETVIDEINRAFRPHGISLQQRLLPGAAGNSVRIQTVLRHESGQFYADGGPSWPAAKQSDPQALMAAVTYGRRGGLVANVGMTQEDDDGATAAKPAAAKKATPKTQLAKIEDRDALTQRIQALPEHLASQIADRLKAEGVKWTQLSKQQYKDALSWYEECKAIADAESEG